MSKRYVVTGEYITVATSDPVSGKRVMLGWYRNALLPEDMSDESIKHHLSTRQIKAVEIGADGTISDYEDLRQTAPAEAEVTDGLGEPNKGPGDAPADNDKSESPKPDGATTSPEVKAGDDVPEPNRRNGTKEEWVDYAVSKGADRQDIEAQQTTKADLIATWGTPK